MKGGSPAGFDTALKDAYFEKMVAVRQPAGLRSIEVLVRWDMDAALRETKQPITVFAIRDFATREAIDRYGDRFDIVLVDLGSHHFPVESPEGTAKLLSGVGTDGFRGSNFPPSSGELRRNQRERAPCREHSAGSNV